MNRLPRAAALAALLLVVTPTAASGHPALNPNELPLGQPTDTILVVPHGCGPGGERPEEGEALPTVEVAIAVTDDFVVEPQPVDGWETTVEDDAVTWTDAGGATTEPIELPLTATVTGGEPGDRYVDVYQECDGGEAFRWTAEPGEDGSPALNLTVVEGEQTSPSPTATGTATPSEPGTTAPSTPSPTPDAEPTVTPDAEPPPTADAAAADDGGSVTPWIVALVVVVVAGAVVVTAVRGRRGSA